MIKFTLDDGVPLYVVPSAIVVVTPRRNGDGSVLNFAGHPTPAFVKEPAIQVLRQLGWEFPDEEKKEIKAAS